MLNMVYYNKESDGFGNLSSTAQQSPPERDSLVLSKSVSFKFATYAAWPESEEKSSDVDGLGARGIMVLSFSLVVRMPS